MLCRNMAMRSVMLARRMRHSPADKPSLDTTSCPCQSVCQRSFCRLTCCLCSVSRLNPVPAGWPFMTGQDHLPNHALPSIDYAAIHLWPDVWSQSSPPWGLRWIQAHADNAALLGKPLVIEEFGKFVGAYVPPIPQPLPNKCLLGLETL